MLWMVAVTFSPAQKAFHSGNHVFIPAGASVSGVFWNTIFTPSTEISWNGWLTLTVGAIRPGAPAETFLPID
ncbi:hypothetical protein D9M72_613170 [compost metagenome]